MFDFVFDVLPHFGGEEHVDVHSHDVHHTDFSVDGAIGAQTHSDEAPLDPTSLAHFPDLMKKIQTRGPGGEVDIKTLASSLKDLTKMAETLGDVQGKLTSLKGLIKSQ